MYFKKFVAVILTISTIATIITSCGASNNTGNSSDTASETSNNRVIIDMSGNEINLPDEIETYAVAWAGLTDILLMFDGTKHLVAYPEKSKSFVWILDIYPEYQEKICLSNEGISSEEIIESGVDVVFMKAADDENLYNRLNECGVTTIDCQFDTYEELQTVVKMIAEVLGSDEALQKADAYCSYLDTAVADTLAFSNTIEENDRVSALVLKDAKDYSAYGLERYTGKWVEMCGGNYSMANEDAYANVNLTSEQIFEYNPDFIFFAMPNQVDRFLNDSTWFDLKAVQNDNVYNMPGGFNTWSNCGAESALVFRWAVSVMYPGKTEFDIYEEIKNFYFEFYEYEPSDVEIAKMMTSSF